MIQELPGDGRFSVVQAYPAVCTADVFTQIHGAKLAKAAFVGNTSLSPDLTSLTYEGVKRGRPWMRENERMLQRST